MLNDENRYLFKFAWKSIRRHAGRSFFIGFSVSLAVVIAVWVVAFFDGFNAQIEKAVVNTNIGFFQIQDPLFAKTTDSSSPLEYTEELKLKIEKYPILSVSPELVLDGNISTPEGAAGLIILGIEPQNHKKFLPIYTHIKEGEFLNQEGEFEILIGQELAEIFKFNINDQMVLNFQDHLGNLRSELLTIKGIFNFNGKSFEKRFVYINQKTWQKLFFNSYSGKILFNRIALMSDGLRDKKFLESRIDNTQLQIRNWKDLNPEMAVVLEFHDGMIKFFFIIIALTITMTILTPVRMLWQERFKELKMMSILGVSIKKFWKIGFFEAFLMIVLSGFFSTLFLSLLISYQAKVGLDFRFLNDGVAIERAGIKLPGIIFPLLTMNQLIVTFLFVIFVLGISYAWSIHRTLRRLREET